MVASFLPFFFEKQLTYNDYLKVIMVVVWQWILFIWKQDTSHTFQFSKKKKRKKDKYAEYKQLNKLYEKQTLPAESGLWAQLCSPVIFLSV